MGTNWRCPHCNHAVTITSDRSSTSMHVFNHGNIDGERALSSQVFVCPNAACKRFTLWVSLSGVVYANGRNNATSPPIRKWTLVPDGVTRAFPDYIPAPILADYREACLIRELSPKASATLSRRCLQGMIRDFWEISKSRLKDEIDAIEDKVDKDTWSAIDAVRRIGNIGAHMERDINVIVEVDPGEAELLINLVETLLEEWYVARHERQQRMNKLVVVASAKDAAKKSGAQP